MAAETASGRGWIILCADDYAMTEGISQSIGELAQAGRISATSVIVTSRHWPAHAARAASLRDRIAVGLHINLTLGSPLGPMPALAANGRFPGIADVTARALRSDIDRAEIAAEVTRQIERFTAECGHPPDLIDGHQHVHALPSIRDGVLDAVAARSWVTPPLVRDPADRLAAILLRRTAIAKAATLAWLARGFGQAARHAGLVSNDSFAGVSDFAPQSTAAELARAALGAGVVHLVMCHPGYPDAELAAIDPVTERRRREHDLLLAGGHFGNRLWRPRRAAAGPPVDWRAALEARP